MPTNELLSTAYALFKSGNFAEAIKHYRKASFQDPDNMDIQLRLAECLYYQDKVKQAFNYLKAIIQASPDFDKAHFLLARLLTENLASDRALKHALKAYQLRPGHLGYAVLLARIYNQKNEWGASIEILLGALKSHSRQPFDWVELGLELLNVNQPAAVVNHCLQQAKKVSKKSEYLLLDAALKLYQDQIEPAFKAARQFTRKYPDHEQGWMVFARAVELHQGVAAAQELLEKETRRFPFSLPLQLQRFDFYQRSGQKENELKLVEQLFQAAAYSFPVNMQLGDGFRNMGALPVAVSAFRRALLLDPDSRAAVIGLTGALYRLGQYEESIQILREALERFPDDQEMLGHLGLCIYGQGHIAEGLQAIAASLKKPQGRSTTFSNYIFLQLHDERATAASIFQSTREFAHIYEQPLKKERFTHWQGSRDSERKLKLGFVSGDLYKHAVASFIEPIWQQLDKEQFEIYVYYTHNQVDEITHRLWDYADSWQSVAHLSEAKLAHKIHQDGMDILLDCSNHTGRNRLLTFARKPAPVQFSLMGIPTSTGLDAMDYRIWPDLHEQLSPRIQEHYAEQLIFVPSPNAQLRPPKQQDQVREIEELPVTQAGVFTFGHLNRASKLSQPLMTSWAQILHQVPESRLLMVDMGDPITRHRVVDYFAQEGIEEARLLLQPRQEMKGYLQLFNQVDLLLDTWPYRGDTTTLDALSMATPLLTLAGDHPLHNKTALNLKQRGLDQMITYSVEDYITQAVALAQSPAQLQAVKEQLLALPIQGSDTPEASPYYYYNQVLRQAWRRWCEGLPAASFHVQPD